MSREQFWAQEFRKAVEGIWRRDDAHILEIASQWADRALAEYDKRFPPT